MTDDAELLRRYAEEKSDEAFGELVRRHIDFVYAAALRQARGNAPLAQDVAQVVFTDLARKASQLARHEVVVGWLHTATRFAVAKAIRSESRRQVREQEAFVMNEALRESDAPVDWERLRPVIDEVLGELKERERAAILLRFFEKKPLAEVGAKLALTEPAARSCVDRALEKMHGLLARRGVLSTAAALGVALASQTAIAAPAGLAASVTGAALVSFAAGGGGLVTFMGMTKLQIGITSVLVAAGTAGFVAQMHQVMALRNELTELHRQNQAAMAMQTENVRLARLASEAEAARVQAAELVQLRSVAAAMRTRLRSGAQLAQHEAVQKTAPPFTGQFFESSQVDQQPKNAFQIPPVYPAELRTAGIGGRALIDFVIDEHGDVRNATVVNATHPAIGEAALEAVRLWRFDAAQKDGHAVAMHKQEPMVFTMRDDKTPANYSTAGQSDGKARPAFVPWF